jgi:anaerobic C4-dicarboxylate transporter DcuB
VAGGLDVLVQIAERLLRAHPRYVTILAPLCTFFLTVAVGTGHAVYALLPVIADVSLRTGIRPERPMAISSVAAQMGITASPVAAAVTTFMAFAAKAGQPVSLFDILKITLPAGIIGVLAAALWSVNRGIVLCVLPERPRRDQHGSHRHDAHRQVPPQPQLHDPRAHRRQRVHHGGVPAVAGRVLKPVRGAIGASGGAATR